MSALTINIVFFLHFVLIVVNYMVFFDFYVVKKRYFTVGLTLIARLLDNKTERAIASMLTVSYIWDTLLQTSLSKKPVL